MSTREQLAEVIRDGVGVWQTPLEAADAILKALAPREVTTVEELEALPVGSVVLHGFRTFQHYPAYPAPFDEYKKWKCPDGGFVRSTKDGTAILPATVIYSPELSE